MNRIATFAAFAGFLILCSSANADWWKDESGQGRGGPAPWRARGGEPPDWARGKGVWDGHLKHGRGGPPPWAGRSGEPPDWTRSKGAWDGHVKRHYGGLPPWAGPPPWAGRDRTYYGGPADRRFYDGAPFYGERFAPVYPLPHGPRYHSHAPYESVPPRSWWQD